MDSLDANPNYLLIACRLFNLVGITVIIANSVVLVVINTSRDLRSRMCLYSFMSVGELLIGSGYVLHGTGVELLLYKNQYFEKITAAQCLKTKPWPLLQIIAGQLTAWTKLAIAIECFIAVTFPVKYNIYWRLHYKVMLGMLGFIYSLVENSAIPVEIEKVGVLCKLLLQKLQFSVALDVT
ncbi:unnamed protein product [Enterobius vermicularis]|uniref:G protein-coupled receptor n=1 Tax=Enterobius vermicularis TaxID=51028 RepID=A0A0N4V4I8_ENTVE|nr:unnamed protein product [Enterobius vermicularis]